MSLRVVRIFMLGNGVLSLAEPMSFLLGGDNGWLYLIFAGNFKNKILNIFLNRKNLIWISTLLMKGIHYFVEWDCIFFHVVNIEILWSVRNIAFHLTLFFASFDRRKSLVLILLIFPFVLFFLMFLTFSFKFSKFFLKINI